MKPASPTKAELDEAGAQASGALSRRPGRNRQQYGPEGVWSDERYAQPNGRWPSSKTLRRADRYAAQRLRRPSKAWPKEEEKSDRRGKASGR